MARFLLKPGSFGPIPRNQCMDLMKINAAVRECLEQCRESDQPELSLAVFALTLRGDSGWEEAEVEYFESSVRRAFGSRLDR
jgi:hypothetical protein